MKEIHGQMVEVTVFKEITKPTYNRDKMLDKIMSADPETVRSIQADIETIETIAAQYIDEPIDLSEKKRFTFNDDILSCSEYMELDYEGELN